MKKIKIINYFAGNIFSVTKAFEHFGAEVEIINSPEDISSADALVLPGVGAFGDGMASLKDQNLDQGIYDFIKTGKTFIGICLGMQLLFSSSEEFGFHEGLNIISGKVKRLPEQNSMKIPHIGWSRLLHPENADANCWKNTILSSYRQENDMYFIHSFAGYPDNPSECLARARYGSQFFCAAVRKDNVWGCQFHPEKSGEAGLDIIKEFLSL